MVSRRPQSADARKVLIRCNGSGDIGLVSPSSLNDAYYILRRQYGENKARVVVCRLMDFIDIVPCGAEECSMSALLDEHDFEDGIIRACAELNEVDFILTRDAAAFRRSKVRSMNCADYLSLFGSE